MNLSMLIVCVPHAGQNIMYGREVLCTRAIQTITQIISVVWDKPRWHQMEFNTSNSWIFVIEMVYYHPKPNDIPSAFVDWIEIVWKHSQGWKNNIRRFWFWITPMMRRRFAEQWNIRSVQMVHWLFFGTHKWLDCDIRVTKWVNGWNGCECYNEHDKCPFVFFNDPGLILKMSKRSWDVSHRVLLGQIS